MRYLLLSLIAACLCSQANAQSAVDSQCTAKGIKLYGKVHVVDALADITVQRVSALADLKVKAVDAFPYNCGEWEWVDSLPDFTVQFVDALPDITIEFVDAFPGRP